MDHLHLDEFYNVIYDAAMDEAQWQNVLGAISDRFPFTASSLAFYEGKGENRRAKAFADFDPSFLKSYERYYAQVNPWVDINMSTPVGPVLNSSHFLPTKDFRKTEFYNDWLRFQEKVDEGLGCTLFRAQDKLALLGVHYNSATISDDQQHALYEFLSLVGPHIQRAIKLQHKLNAKNRFADDLEAALSCLSCAVLLINGKAEIQFANTPATNLFQDEKNLISDRFQRLIFSNENEQDKFNSALSQVLSPTFDPQNQTPVCYRSQCERSGKQFVFNFFPIIPNDKSNSAITPQALSHDRHALVFITQLQEQIIPNEMIVSSALGVTPAEAQLAISVANGKTIREFAQQKGISHNTTRSQMQSLLEKLELRRQSDLTSLMVKAFGQFRFD